MLKQNLTKVIAMAAVAACALFIAGCGEEVESTPVTEDDPLMKEEMGDDSNSNKLEKADKPGK